MSKRDTPKSSHKGTMKRQFLLQARNFCFRLFKKKVQCAIFYIVLCIIHAFEVNFLKYGLWHPSMFQLILHVHLKRVNHIYSILPNNHVYTTIYFPVQHAFIRMLHDHLLLSSNSDFSHFFPYSVNIFYKVA